MWNGTKDLLTRSKKGHMPRLLLKIDYIGGFFIGDLLERLSLIPNEGKTEESYDDINDFTVDTAKLNAELKKYADRIEKVHLQIDDRIKLTEPIFQK
jgi:CRISPR-associated protein Csh2